jgi:hypothetical protein
LSKNSQLTSLFTDNKQQLSQVFAASSVSKLNVYYESFYYTQVTESAQITPSTLMGTIGLKQKSFFFSLKINLYLYLKFLYKGGQLGLFIGISLLSVFEIAEFWIDFLSNLIRQKMNPKKQVFNLDV